VREAGGEPILLPALEIEAIALDADARARLTPDRFDWVIFTSANAVEFALRALAPPRVARVAAIGRASARALEARGIEVHAVPRKTTDSEGLLEHEALRDLHGRTVLILKGAGGRTLLREELARRGATVVLGDVYRRVTAATDVAALEVLSRALGTARIAVAVTSAEVLAALLDIAPESRFAALRDAPLVAPGERVTAEARKRGWRGLFIVARSAEDAAMLEALVAAAARGGPLGMA
jgi:uroporphyrinogen-III synthase